MRANKPILGSFCHSDIQAYTGKSRKTVLFCVCGNGAILSHRLQKCGWKAHHLWVAKGPGTEAFFAM